MSIQAFDDHVVTKFNSVWSSVLYIFIRDILLYSFYIPLLPIRLSHSLHSLHTLENISSNCLLTNGALN